MLVRPVIRIAALLVVSSVSHNDSHERVYATPNLWTKHWIRNFVRLKTRIIINVGRERDLRYSIGRRVPKSADPVVFLGRGKHSWRRASPTALAEGLSKPCARGRFLHDLIAAISPSCIGAAHSSHGPLVPCMHSSQAWMPIHTDWRLNEQMYGALQGLNKRATAERYGTELTQQWRRSCEKMCAQEEEPLFGFQ